MSLALLPPAATGFLRRAPRWLLASLLLCLVYVAFEVGGLDRRFPGHYPSLTFLAAMSLFAGWEMSRAARRLNLPVRVRSALKFATAALVVDGLATLYLLVERIVNPNHAYFSVADGLFLSVYPLMLIGLSRLPAGEHSVASRTRILVDGAVFAVGLGVPLWLFAIQPEWHKSSGLDALLLVLWPATAFVGVFGLNVALLTKASLPTRGALWLLIAAFGLQSLGDLVFSLDAAARIISGAFINWVNLTAGGSLAIYLLAAWRFQVDPVPARTNAQPAAFSPVPLVAIVVVVAWLALLITTSQPRLEIIEHLLPSLLLLLVVLVVRETLVMRDSQRWMAAEAQRESQARFEAMVRNSSDVIMIVDQGRRIRFASPGTMPMLGQTPDMLLGQDLFHLVHPEDETAGTRFLNELLHLPGETRFLNWRLRNRNGSYCHLETAGSNLLHEATIEGFVLNSRDVSERMALEMHLHNAAKMEAIGRLAGGIAHDFNNLLTVILANSELALMDLPADSPVRQDIEQVRQAGSRGTALTSRLLSFSRSENLQPRIISPAERLLGVAPVIQRLIQPNLTLHTEIEPDSGLVEVNPDSFEQGLLHLATNARDASAPGGSLTFSIRRVTLQESLDSAYLAAPPGRYVVVAATDTGTGMDAATCAKLFEPFFTTKERGRGTGLGLASIFGTVKTAGGGLMVRSSPGQGTTVELWLPEASRETAPASPARTETASGGSETILLVEDEPAVREITHRILVAKGYKVLVACDANDARTVLGSHLGPVHLMLTDVMMPGESGPELAATLVGTRPDLQVLYMSGYTGNELEAHGLVHSDERLLVKPFTVAELTSRLRKIRAARPRRNRERQVRPKSQAHRDGSPARPGCFPLA